MNYVQITFLVDDLETEQALGLSEEDDIERTLECEFDFEPADRSVGIMRESFELFRVVDEETGRELHESDLPRKVWERIEQQMERAAKNEAEAAKVEAKISRMEWDSNYPL